MKYLFAIIFLISIATYSGCNSNRLIPASLTKVEPQEAIIEPVDEKVPVLVELFTSEGCSSCPPADRLLIDIAAGQPYKNVDVITLGFHVDYWDHIGWRDRFSSSEFSKRQEEYAGKFKLDSIYTPQIIVDGDAQVVGNDSRAVGNAITRSKGPKAEVRVGVKGDKLSVTIEKLGEQKGSTVFLAVAESGLRSSVGSGENSGRMLEHASVVRELRKVGSIGAGQTAFTGELTLAVNSEWKSDRIRYVVLIRDDATLKILGVGATGG
jgi:hypothetical protein